MFCPRAPEHLAEQPMANPVSTSTDSQLAERQREIEIDREGDWETKAATERERLRIEVDDTSKATDENGNTEAGRKRLVKGRQIDGLRWVLKTKWKLEEERGEVGQEDVWTQGNGLRGKKHLRKKLAIGPGAGWTMGEEGAEWRKPVCARCLPNPFVTQRLISVCEWASGYK